MNIITGPHAPESTGSCHLTSAQLDMLIDYMGQHRELARGELRSIEDRVYAKQLWVELVKKLNSMEGAKKSLQQWQRVWTDKKYLTKNLALATAKAKADGVPAPKLTYMDQKILDIISGEQNITTLLNSNPFESEKDSTAGSDDDDEEEDVKHTPDIVRVISDASEQKSSGPKVKIPVLRIVPPESSTHPRARRNVKGYTFEAKTEAAIQNMLNLEEQRLRNDEQRNAELSLIRISVQEMCSLMREFISKYGEKNNSF